MSLNFLLYLRVLIHAVSRTGLLKQRIVKSAFCVTHSIFSSLPPNREEYLLDSICRTLCSYSHKTCSSYRYTMLCLLWNLPFQKHFHSFLSFYQFLPVNTRSHYCSSHEQILYLILKLSQIGIRLYLLNRYFHLTLLQFRIQVDTSILIVCLILKFQYSCFSFCFSLIFSM